MGVIGSSSTPRSTPLLICLIKRSPRHVGIRLNHMCGRTQRPGSGCTNIGATFPQTPTGLILSTPIFTDHSKTCFSTTVKAAPQRGRACRGVCVKRLAVMLRARPIICASILFQQSVSPIVARHLRSALRDFQPVADFLNQLQLLS
jgi:hypothetical protein